MSDLIDRQAVIESICKQYTEHNAIVPIWLSIGDLPSVTPTQNCVENALGALDCISRQAVLDKTIRRNSVWKSITNIEGKNIEEILSELPSVNPQEIVRDCTSCRWSKDGCCAGTEECHLCMWESQYKPKTGHWIMDRKLETRQCDKCMTVYRWSFNPHNYCPNCGCRMFEPQESEEISDRNMKMWEDIFKAESEEV